MGAEMGAKKMRAQNRLSASFVTNAKTPGKYLDGGGLILAVRKNGSRHWLLRYQRNGMVRGMGLGSLRNTSLAAARAKADAARRNLAAGIDPINQRIGERQQEAAAAAQLRSVREVAALFFAKHQGRWAKEQDWVRSLDLYVHPVIGKVAIADVGVPHVLKVVEPHWARIPETMRRVLGRLEELIDFARIAGLRRDDSNPAKWSGGLDAVLPPPSKLKPVEHHAAMDYRAVPDFMTKLRAEPGVAARALEFLILTSTRMSEIRFATWAEVDGDVWVVPSERMKMRKSHRVPLSPRAVEILREMRGQHPEVIFPGSRSNRPCDDNTISRVLHRLAGPLTAHGFRSSLRTWAAEDGAFAPEIAEAALAHAIKSGIERAYKRTTFFDHRRKLMVKWADYCAGKVTVVTGGEVVAMHGARHG
jgi:integrase